MKALLTTPLYNYFLVFPNFQQVISDAIEHTEIYPPLGLHYIASYVNKYTDHEVTVLDPYALKLDYATLKREIRFLNPDVVGITAITPQWRDCVETAKIVKEANPNIYICVGGPHANIYPEEINSTKLFNSVLFGEAEYSFAELLDRLEKEDPEFLDAKQNTIFINNGKRDIPVIKNLDLLPFPDRKSMSLELYRTTFGRKESSTSIITQRGCPFRCAFCFHLFGRTCRSRSPQNVVDELKECVGLNIKKFTFWDDTFTINKRWVIELCDSIKKERLDISWEVRGRVNMVDEEMLRKLFGVGCNKIHFGVESGVQKNLDLMKKDITLDQVRDAVRLSKKIGFKTYTNWMIGLPYETLGEMDQTVDFACSLKGLDFANFAVYYPLPNTDFYEMGLREGVFDDYWREYTKNPTDGFKLRAWDYDIPFEILMNKLNECFHRFYVRPTKIANMLKTVESFEDFKIYSKAGWWLLKEKLK